MHHRDHLAAVLTNDNDDVDGPIHHRDGDTIPVQFSRRPMADPVGAATIPCLQVNIGMLQYEIDHAGPDSPLLGTL